MKKLSFYLLHGVVLSGLFSSSLCFSAEWKSAYVPELRYATVDGNENKFEAQHWMNAGWDAGLSEFTLENEDLQGVSARGEFRALPGNYDYFADMKFQKDNDWHYGILVKNFRKYYDSLGGVHPYGNQLRVVDSGRDLFVDIGKLEVEGGFKHGNLPHIDLAYEYEYKTGTKSRLTWASVKDGGTALKTGPSWQEVDEEVHVFEVNLHDTYKGYQWSSEQKWEHFSNHSLREEKQLSTTSVAADKMIRHHILDPKSDLFTSVWDIKKWFFKDKALATAGYRYSQVENSEVETILEMNESLQVFNFSANSHQVLPSDSTNQYNSHTGVASFFYQITQDLTAGLKGKMESIKRNGQSTLNNDVSSVGAPDRVADRFDVSNTDSDIKRFGEGLSLRFSGIENLSLYNDLEFEQTHNDLYEDRQSRAAGEVFTRQTLNQSYRGVEQFGFRYRPCESFLWNTQYRYRRDNIDYDDEYETVASGGARSAFFDGQKGEVHEVTTRFVTHLTSWLKPTVRYQFQNYDLTSYFEGSNLRLGSDTFSHTTTVDIPLEITQRLSITPSFQHVDMITTTFANEVAPRNYAPFQGDTTTWMTQADFFVSEKISLTSSIQYQTAENVMSINSTGVPYGANYDKVDLSIGVRYNLSKKMTLEPRYDFYSYDPNENIESGEYNAHVFWLGLAINWA